MPYKNIAWKHFNLFKS